MADQKISQLTAATTPVAGTEVLPFVQSGATKKVSIAELLPGLGTIPTTQGGTGLTSFTNKGIPYATSTSALTTGTALVFDGTNLGVGTNTPDKNVTIANPATGVPTLKLSGFADGASGIPYAIINFFNEDGSQAGPNNAAAIKALNADANGSGGQLGFFTSPTDAAEGADAVERLRLTSVGDATLISGNFVQGTAAKGVNFTANTPAAGMTSQLLNWYEEGAFTPTFTGSGGNPTVTYSTRTGKYTRTGNVVNWTVFIVGTATGGSGNLGLSGLPFTVGEPGATSCNFVFNFTAGAPANGIATATTTTLALYSNIVASDNTQALTSSITGGATFYWRASGFYFV